MISIIPSDQRHHANHGWLDTHWHFSFGDYHDAKNMHWSVLRVFNDDTVQPGRGFDMHPHRDMEIVSYVIDGQLKHQDHLGNSGIVHPGEVQVMSAGAGITHAEFNPSSKHPVHFLQLWILPRTKGLPARWAQKQFTTEQRRGRLLPIVTDVKKSDPNGAMTIDQDATIYVADLKTGQTINHHGNPGRHAYLFVIDGQVTLNDQPMTAGDQARITDEAELRIVGKETDAHLMLLDLP